MKTEHGKIDGDLRVNEELRLNGMVTGSVQVQRGGVLYLEGMVCGDLQVERDAAVELRGTVAGNVINEGGRLRVFGTVDGGLRHVSGNTLVHAKAVVRGGITGATEPLVE